MDDDVTPLPYGVENGRRVLYVTYKGDCRMVHHGGREHVFLTRTLADTLSCVRPGDIVQLLPGKYWPPILYDEDAGGVPVCHPLKLNEINGLPDVPITIRGLGAATLLDGGLGGVPRDSMLPELKHFAYFKLTDCSWIEFENFHVENCWPTFLYMQNARYITVRGVVAKDSRYLVFARGRTTHHILLENNRWRQDPTSSMWRDLLWLDSKKKRYFYYNGGLFGSVGIPGSVVLRGNTLCDTFNGMRMKADKDNLSASNLNVEIYDNTFLRTRDNPVEPEAWATNWWVHHNRIHNAHAWFSLDEVGGGFWYYFANTGWITDKPGSRLDPARGGKVYKYDKDGPYPEKPAFCFNNSYFLFNSLIKEGVTANLMHVNNAVLFRDELPRTAPQHQGVPCPMPAQVRRPFMDGNTGNDRFLGKKFMPGAWEPSVVFDWDLTNLPWPDKVLHNGQEDNGVSDPSAAFVKPDQGDLRLVGGPPPGRPLTLLAVEDWPGLEDWTSGPDTPMGAYMGEREEVGDETFVGRDAAKRKGTLVDGPAFVFLAPEGGNKGYVEMPRLVRLETREQELRLYFSTYLEDPGPFTVRVKLWEPAGVTRFRANAAVSGRAVLVTLPEPLAGRRLKTLKLPDTLRASAGKDGKAGPYATLWASTFPGLRFYRGGEEPRVEWPKAVCFCVCGEEV